MPCCRASTRALWRAARRLGIALALLDIDGSKAINDVHGHAVGDRALLHLGRHMLRSLGPEDQFSRLGGDEFMLVSTRGGRGQLETSLRLVIAARPDAPGRHGAL